MSDWEVVKINKKNIDQDSSDWEIPELASKLKRKNQQGIKGIGHDIYETFAEPLRHPITSALETLSSLGAESYGLGKQAISLPFETIQAAMAPIEELPNKIPRLTKNIVQGFENIVNTPANIAGYLGNKGIIFPPDVAEKAHINVNPFKMGESQQGDIFAQSLPSIALLGGTGELGELGQAGRTGSRAAAGAGMGITQNQNPIQTALLNSVIPGIMEKTPGFTNKSIANKLSQDKKLAINQASNQYNEFFNKAKQLGIEEINKPGIFAGNIVKNTRSDYHKALVKFLEQPTIENAHWAQSDLGFAERHLKKLDETVGLSSTKHETLKHITEARNRIKQAMFNNQKMKNNPQMEKIYNQLSLDYANNVVPFKQIDELHKFENKKITRNNLIKSLLNNDEFMLGIGKNYPQIQINRALRSKPAKILGGSTLAGALGGLGFEEGRKFIR